MTVYRTKDVKVVMINRKAGVEYELKGFLSSSIYQDINTPIKELFKVHVNPSWKELLNIQKDDRSKFHIVIYSGKAINLPNFRKMKAANVITQFTKEYPTQGYINSVIKYYQHVYYGFV